MPPSLPAVPEDIYRTWSADRWTQQTDAQIGALDWAAETDQQIAQLAGPDPNLPSGEALLGLSNDVPDTTPAPAPADTLASPAESTAPVEQSAVPPPEPGTGSTPLPPYEIGAGVAGQPTDLRTLQRGDLVPNQFGDPSLSTDEAYAACGPAAAVAFARSNGRNPTLREALDLAKSVGWSAGGGMNGLGNQAALLQKMGIPAEMDQSGDWGKIEASARRGDPVTISTPVHYFVADAYDPRTGQYHVGASGTAFRSGKPWMTQQEITAIGGGLNGALFTKAVPSGREAPEVALPAERYVAKPLPVEVMQLVGQVTQAAGQAVEGAAGAVGGAVQDLRSFADNLIGRLSPQQPARPRELSIADEARGEQPLPFSFGTPPTALDAIQSARQGTIAEQATGQPAPERGIGPLEQANRLLDRLQPGGVNPWFVSSDALLQSASPEEVARARQDLTTGLGARVREKAGITGPPTDQEIAEQIRTDRLMPSVIGMSFPGGNVGRIPRPRSNSIIIPGDEGPLSTLLLGPRGEVIYDASRAAQAATPPAATGSAGHVVGAGYLGRGIGEKGQAAVREAFDAAKGSYVPTTREDVAAMARAIADDPHRAEALVGQWAALDPNDLAAQGQFLRESGIGAAIRVADATRRAQAAKESGIALSFADRLNLVDETIAAAATTTVQASRKFSKAAATALQQMQYRVTAQIGRQSYQALDSLSTAANDALPVLRDLANGRGQTLGGTARLQNVALQLETNGHVLTDEGGAIEAAQRVATAAAERTGKAPPAIKDDPLLKQAEEIVRLNTAEARAKESGSWQAVRAVQDQREALLDELRAAVEGRRVEALARAAQKTSEPMGPAGPEQAVRAGARDVLKNLGQEVRQRLPNPVQAQTTLADIQQGVLGKTTAALEKEHAQATTVLQEDVYQGVLDAIQKERSSVTGTDFTIGLRDKIEQALEKERFDRISSATGGLQSAFAKTYRQNEISDLAGRVRELARMAQNPMRGGPESHLAAQELLTQMRDLGGEALTRASAIREHLFRAGLLKYTQREAEDADLNRIVKALMAVDPNRPEQVTAVMRGLRHPELAQYITEGTVVNMLSGPLTTGLTGVNMTSNAIQTALRVLVYTPAEATHEALRYRLRGQTGTGARFGDVGTILGGMRENVGKASRRAGQVLARGNTEDAYRQAAELGDLGSVRREVWTEKLGPLGALGHILSTRPLEAGDQFLGTMIYEGMADALATRKARMLIGQGAQRGSVDEVKARILASIWDHPDILKQAGKIEDYTLLRGQGESRMDRAVALLASLKAVRPNASAAEQAGALLVHQIVPFIGIPYNFLKQGLENGPVGIVGNTLRYLGAKTAEEQQQIFSHIAAGTVITGTGLGLLLGDNLTGDGPSDPREYATWSQDHQRQSFRMPGTDRWFSYQNTPFAITFSTLANAKEAGEEAAKKQGRKFDRNSLPELWLSAVEGATQGTVSGILHQSFVQNLGDLYDYFSGRKRFDVVAAGQINRFVPLSGMLGFLARAGDAVQRAPQSVGERLSARIPGLSGQQPERQGLFGQPVENQQQGLAALAPWRPYTPPTENADVLNAVRDYGLSVPDAPQHVTRANVPIPLTAEEQRQFRQQAGALIAQRIRTEVAAPSFQKLSDVGKQHRLQRLIDTARESVGNRMLDQLPGPEYQRRKQGVRLLRAPVGSR
ncbi:MAG: hypothetical protein NUW22_13775 [Acidobacteria bacterium]|nr:hypothetical protein [Acidobacteriota bacterium]